MENTRENYGEIKDELMHAMYRFKNVSRRKHGLDNETRYGEHAIHHVNMAELIFMQRIAEREDDDEYEGTWLSSMSEYLCISKAAVSQMLSSLEKKGYITRETNPENRREIIVRLTKVSEEQIAAHQKVFDNRVDLLIDRFGAQDTKELIRLVNKLADILSEADV
ncbi:MAG: MarR family transcriptional regulator [Clostridiales Family XIII bacterium]|nr:MarR family transcriptional regulator [Clostridiales Family XIII bacterium]